MLPVFVFLAVFTAFAIGLWFSALNTRFRDVRYTVPFLLRLWMFLTPVAYPTEKIVQALPAGWARIYSLNPMVAVVDGFRWALLQEAALDTGALGLSLAAVLVVFASGLFYFRYTERTLADLV